MKIDDLIKKYACHFSVTTCGQLSRDSTPYPMTARARMGVGFDRISSKNYKVFDFSHSPGVKARTIFSHRVIFYIRNGYLPDCVDHANHNTLDNRAENLRASTISQNCMNSRSRKNSSSKYLGVSWHKRNKMWSARINVNKKNRYLGSFTSEKEAAKAYNTAAAKHFGEFANLNDLGGIE